MEEAGIEIDVDTDSEDETETSTDAMTLEDYDISDLEAFMREAIEEEDYAKASVLRDIINKKKMLL